LFENPIKNGILLNVRTWVSGESLLLTNAADQKYILKVIQTIHVQKEAEHSIMLLNDFFYFSLPLRK